jgi:hypothetical protein
MKQNVFALLVWALGTCVPSAYAQLNGPDGATRWEQGAAWLPDGSIDDSPGSGPINGIIRCGSAAETQSQIDPTGTYDPGVFEIVVPTTGCVNPSSGEEVSVLPPTVGEPVIWLNFDVRAYSGVYEIQINDNSGDAIGWALYASASPTSGVTQNATTGEWLSGSTDELTFLSCGIESSASWNALPVPQFNVPTNCYLAIWDQDADGDLGLSNFKARFGCGDSGALLCSVAIADVATSCVDGLVHAEVSIEGVNGLYQISAPTAEVLAGAEGVCLGTVGSPEGVNGSYTLVFESGEDVVFEVAADLNATACEVAPNASECAASFAALGVICQVDGCTDATALDDSPHATLDNGTCAFQWCPDFNRNGAVQVNDLMNVLSVYGLTY